MFIKKYLLTKTILYIRNNIRIQYHTNIVDHYEHLRNIDSLDKRNINVGSLDKRNINIDSLDKRNINVGTGFVGSPLCNDVIKLQIKVNSCGIIENAVFKTFGCNGVCSSATVYAFYTTEILHGMHINNALLIKNTDIDRHLMIPVKLNCSMLAEDAIKCAVENYKQKNK
jgi:NifU-like protein involved in Fe-S cluster formation